MTVAIVLTIAIALLFSRILGLLVRLRQAIETELAVRHAVSELKELNDYMLRDLGITRSEIEDVVRRPGARTERNEDSAVAGDEAASIVRGIGAVARRPDAPVRSLPPQAAA